MTTSSEWSQLRSDLLEEVWQLVTSWDGTTKHALEIIENNQNHLDQWQASNNHVVHREYLPYTESEKEKQADILRYQQSILNIIRSERMTVMSRMKQVNQKNKVRDNYISVKPDSIFIDKGL
ncbi:hypothetical protein [Carnobacterium mobile]|uniref:hypothetical protein n=1 Tax=Carnobacterium mobile TaxID=2750 RepID=UPI000552946A|nr:hypothetical protein [Carnobacterium mobile]